MIATLASLFFAGVALCSCSVIRSFGRSPRGHRLERMRLSPNYWGGGFHNIQDGGETDGISNVLLKEYEGSKRNRRPKYPIPVMPFDLHGLSRDVETLLWLGHSCVFIQSGGVRYLFDPVLSDFFPENLLLRSFQKSGFYTPEDIPAIDFLVITHDHWDHLDYITVCKLKERIGRVVCGLGVGEYFEYWGYPAENISELDWGDSLKVKEGIFLHCLPAVHYSQRFIKKNKTLWASWLINSYRKIFISGDGALGPHFLEIGEKFKGIDIAIMENGQYNIKKNKKEHSFPEECAKEIEWLKAARVLPYHNSKYAISNHEWNEPMKKLHKLSKGKSWKLLTPMIGEPVYLDRNDSFKLWWEAIPQ